MQKNNSTITLMCPECKETFEFDHVGEFQLVPCPICGIEFMTFRKGQLLLLKPFEFKQESPDNQNETALLVKMEMR